jgi:hypothetical protein
MFNQVVYNQELFEKFTTNEKFSREKISLLPFDCDLVARNDVVSVYNSKKENGFIIDMGNNTIYKFSQDNSYRI